MRRAAGAAALLAAAAARGGAATSCDDAVKASMNTAGPAVDSVNDARAACVSKYQNGKCTDALAACDTAMLTASGAASSGHDVCAGRAACAKHMAAVQRDFNAAAHCAEAAKAPCASVQSKACIAAFAPLAANVSNAMKGINAVSGPDCAGDAGSYLCNVISGGNYQCLPCAKGAPGSKPSKSACDESCPAPSACKPSNVCNALMGVYVTNKGTQWKNSDGWGKGASPCAWFGVKCDSKGHVTELDLHSNGLSGPLDALKNLTHLTHLHLYNNQLSGPLDALMGLSSLTHLHLFDNQLTGPLDPVQGLTSLTYLNMDNNQLTGSLESIEKLTQLTQLYLSMNRLTHSLVHLKGMSSLTQLHLHDNQLTGALDTLQKLSSLTCVVLGNNKGMGGQLPALPFSSYTCAGSSSKCDLSGIPFTCPMPAGAEQYCNAACK